MIDISYKQLVETEQPIRRGFKNSLFWQQDERSKVKQSEMGFTQMICMHGSQQCVFFDSKAPCGRKKVGCWISRLDAKGLKLRAIFGRVRIQFRVLVESFFKNDEDHNVTVNGDRNRAMITNFFIPELNNHDVQELWFQQDGATCHTARATIDLLKDTFGDRLISRLGPVNWPPRSCDLTPLHYFLWGYVKSLVYADKPQTLDHLEDNIHRVIADIRPQMLEKVIENWTSRLDYIRASRGSPMTEIIFKM
ncbi:putative LOC100569746 [Trichonephila clavipes]|uniref:Putative LOC100569746 n=1 Tax=Trichonephila clavipes TaxID=2585209 RepID=A0A8X6VAW3_TRICX|nr:putative LOC100569746 [Trichonephila clavipes]